MDIRQELETGVEGSLRVLFKNSPNGRHGEIVEKEGEVC